MTTRADLCGCIKCTDARIKQWERNAYPMAPPEHLMFPGPVMPGWRYACEKCGNKRCPHHSNHELACTNSNAPGQEGSFYQ